MRKQFLMKWLLSATLAVAVHPAFAQPGKGVGNGNGGQSEIQKGFAIAPAPLNLSGKNIGLVGLGSYLVNGPMDCIGCHTVGLYAAGGDPFLGQPAIINTATYLGGGAPFGPFISRNLTPDKDGLPGGLTYDGFLQVMRMGTDLKAIPPHVPGNPGLLQVMPWPAYRNATDQTLRAIYEYLSAIPCLEGGPGQLPNRCGP
jgi:hypothetical protein